MQLTSSISGFNDDEDINYFIDTTQIQKQTKSIDNHQNNYSTDNDIIKTDKSIHNYISKLEKKIISQSKKISELEKYKYKCEQFIKKLNPYQILPITDEMLTDLYEIVKDPINAAEQQNYVDLLKKTIENELIKNGLINHNIKAEEIIDFAKIKLENEDCKKQLLLARSMISGLKNDLVELTKENQEYKMNKYKILNINNNESIKLNNNQILDLNRKLMNYKENYEKINKDFEKLINEKKQIKKENSKLKKEINLYKEQTIKINKELDENIKNKNFINIEENEDKNELILENITLKRRLDNLLQEKNKLEKQNKLSNEKISELNKKHKTEKEKLFQEINKLINEIRIIKEKQKEKEINSDNNDKEYITDDTEEGENKKMNGGKDLINISKKYDELNMKYSILNKKYESLLIKYGKNVKENDKIKELINKRNIYKDTKINEVNNILEKSMELNDKNDADINININNTNKNDNFDYNKIKYMLWEMDNELNEKNKIILENKNTKNELENEINNKFQFYDEYITNNKTNIKNLLNQLLNLLILFKEKHELLSKNNSEFNYISNQFLVDIDKIINQINTINNINNYDIELDDKIFFETINNFMSLLNQEIILVYTKAYKYEKYNFHHRSKSEVSKNDETLLTKTKFSQVDIDIMKEMKEIKRQNHYYIKENFDLKGKLNDLNSKLNEFIVKYNYNQKTVSTCNEGKKNLLNMMFKFIKNINDNDLVKIIYEILNISEQINLVQINKCLVEEKLNIIMKNNQDLNGEYSINLEEYLLSEINKLNKLLDDYDSQIEEKSVALKKLNDEYEIKEEQYSNYMRNLIEKENP